MQVSISFSPLYQKDIRRAVTILKEAGCSKVFLFGSLASGNVREGSDIDLAVRGCPQGKFFFLLGKLLMELEHPIDLVDLDKASAFARYLEKEGELIQVD